MGGAGIAGIRVFLTKAIAASSLEACCTPLAAWQQLGIDRVLRDAMQVHPTSQPLERALFAVVANRALAPYSKLYCHQQWLKAL